MPGTEAAELSTLTDVHTFSAGDHAGNEPGEVWTYTSGDLAEIARNFAALSEGDAPLHRVPVVVTHDGVEAYGWVRALRATGADVYTDWADVDPDLAAAIAARKFDSVSAEIRPEFLAPDGTRYGQHLYRVAVLGADVPRVKGMAPLREAKWFCERAADPPARSLTGVKPMAAAATPADVMLATLKQTGYSDAFLSSLSEEQLAMLFQDSQKIEAAEAGEPPASGQGGGNMALVDGVDMDRQAIIDELVNTYGYDPAELDTKSDDELAALLSQERAAAAGGAMSDPLPAVPPVGAGGAAPSAPPAPALPRRFAERLTALERRLRAAEQDARAVRHHQRQANRTATRKRIEETLTRLSTPDRNGMVKVEPWELDETHPSVPGLLQEGLALAELTTVRKFSQGGRTVTRTPLDDWLARLEARRPRRFSEQVLQPGAGGGEKVSDARRRELLAHTSLGRAILRDEKRN